MEKDYSCLFSLKYQDLLHRIVNRVREKARGVPAFRDSGNGCIRITMVPLSGLADVWLSGGLSSFGEFPEVNVPDICEREFIFAIRPGGSHTIARKSSDDGHIEPVNCYAYSAMKTAFAAWRRQFETRMGKMEVPSDMWQEQRNQETRYFTEENGWSTHVGAVAATLSLDGENFMRIYVCTSGANEREDEDCSLAGMHEVQDFFYSATEMVRNNYPDGVYTGTLDFKMNPDFVSLQDC